MQDRTINNALLALRRQGGAQAHMAEALLILRDVPVPRVRQVQQLKRSQAGRVIVAALADGPMTASQLGEVILCLRPGITVHSANNRVYQALLRLEAKGVVRRGLVLLTGQLWRLA